MSFKLNAGVPEYSQRVESFVTAPDQTTREDTIVLFLKADVRCEALEQELAEKNIAAVPFVDVADLLKKANSQTDLTALFFYLNGHAFNWPHLAHADDRQEEPEWAQALVDMGLASWRLLTPKEQLATCSRPILYETYRELVGRGGSTFTKSRLIDELLPFPSAAEKARLRHDGHFCNDARYLIPNYQPDAFDTQFLTDAAAYYKFKSALLHHYYAKIDEIENNSL